MSAAPCPEDPQALARAWYAALLSAAADGRPSSARAPEEAVPILAALCALALADNRTLLLVVADDNLLPDLSNALDLSIRPLCLVLPGADFAARITLRASIALLKSRLARGGEDDFAEAWSSERQRLEDETPLWQAARDWTASNDAFSPWPARVAELFPLRILPASQVRRLPPAPTDLTVLFDVDRLPADIVATRAGRTLALDAPPPRVPFMGALQLSDDATRLRAELDVLGREVGELELELATAEGEIAAFTRRYHDVVGTRMVTLDGLQAEIASARARSRPADPEIRARASEARHQAEHSRHEQARYEEASRQAGQTEQAAPSFTPSRDLKKLFRQVAQKIHPDRARDENDRQWRTQLMAEANRAYRAGDDEGLQEVLALWHEGRPAMEVGPTGDTLERQVDRMRRRLDEIRKELDRLYASRLYELFIASRLARRQHRDLLHEMATQLDIQIDAARAELAQLTPSA